MSFTTATARTPTTIGEIILTLRDPIGDPQQRSASYDVCVLDQQGVRIRTQGDLGDLVPLLTGTEVNQLLAIMDRLRPLAEVGFLPQG